MVVPVTFSRRCPEVSMTSNPEITVNCCNQAIYTHNEAEKATKR